MNFEATESFAIESANAENALIKLSPDELIKVKTLSDPQLSSDGQFVLFTVQEARIHEEKECFVKRIYRTNLDKKITIPLTSEHSSSFFPRWSPQQQWIAFLSTRSEIANLYLIRSEGGEPTQLTNVSNHIQLFKWSPDGQKIAFVMEDETEAEKHCSSLEEGIIYKKQTRINRLWIIDLSDQLAPRPLTTDAYHVRGKGDLGSALNEFDWTPDSQSIIFSYCTASGLEKHYLESKLAKVDLNSGAIFHFEQHARYEALPHISPNGQWIAYVSSNDDYQYSLTQEICIRSFDGKQIKKLHPTFNEAPSVATSSLLGWSHDQNSVICYEPKGTRFHCLKLPIDGSKPVPLVETQLLIRAPCLSSNGLTLSFIGQDSYLAPEVYISSIESFEPIQTSHLNSYFHSRIITATERIYWKASDQFKIEGLLTFPLNYVRGQRYPLLVELHGGPWGCFQENFLGNPTPYPLASFAEAGFMILRPNPRGSNGYGKEFRHAVYEDWGGKDLEDIFLGIDYLISKGLADVQKLGVMGWSYGGYLTARAITTSDRFKAASIGAGISNLISLCGTTDLHHFLPDFFRGDFSEKRALYEERSPIFNASKVSASCLIQHGTDDQRVPISQAYEFYHALERTGKKPKLILYPSMGHQLHHPRLLAHAMEQNLQWFKKHLL